MSELNSRRKRKPPNQPSFCRLDRIIKLLAAEQLSLSDYAFTSAVTRQSIHNESWRERVAQWFYDVMDYLDAPRDIVYMSMTILDRYVFANSNLMESEYRSAGIASLFIAVRLSGALKRLSIQRLLQISQSGVSNRDALSMVNKILKTLRLDHPLPSPSSFVRAFLSLFEGSLSNSQLSKLKEHALYLAELSVCDAQFDGVNPSKLAFAAVILSINPATGPSSVTVSHKSTSRIMQTLSMKTGFDYSSMGIQSICSKLQSTHGQSWGAAIVEDSVLD